VDNKLIQPVLTQLKIIESEKGAVYHALKRTESSFFEFGEAYFSFVNKGAIKGWKKHKKLTMNIIVPVGVIKFVVCHFSSDKPIFSEYILGPGTNYSRLTVPPGYWLAFEGLEDINCLLNVADLEHEKLEADNISLNEIKYSW